MDVAVPVLWILAGPNGAGKSTYYDKFVSTRFRAPFVNADRIALELFKRHPQNEAEMREATMHAEQRRNQLIAERKSFVAETVFSHPSKLELMRSARDAGYFVRLSYVGVAEPGLCALRVQGRVAAGGHDVPLDRIAKRYRRSIEHARQAVLLAHWGMVLDNSSAGEPYRQILLYEAGELRVRSAPLPAWVRDFPGTRQK